jgi:hypothetical protein
MTMKRSTLRCILLGFAIFDVLVAAALFFSMELRAGHLLEATADGVLCAGFLLMAMITSARIRRSDQVQ